MVLWIVSFSCDVSVSLHHCVFKVTCIHSHSNFHTSMVALTLQVVEANEVAAIPEAHPEYHWSILGSVGCVSPESSCQCPFFVFCLCFFIFLFPDANIGK